MKRHLPWGIVFATFSLVPGLSTAQQPATAQAPATGSVAPSEFRTFQANWRAGNHDAADAFARRVIDPGAAMRGLQAVMEYLLFERGQCDFDSSDPRIPRVLEHERRLRAGMIVCAAARDGADEVHSIEALARIRAVEKWGGRSRVFDQFARQPTINVAALRWLRRHDRVDSIPALGKDALSEQILAGRVDNVRILLEEGYDPNRAVLDPREQRSVSEPDGSPLPARRGLLPLAAARQSLAGHGRAGIEIARLLLQAGADPYKLAWYPERQDGAASVAIDPGLLADFEKEVDAAKPGHSPVAAEFVGFRVESAPSGPRMYARLLIGNGGAAKARIPAWSADGVWLLDGLPVGGEVQLQPPGARDWRRPLLIAHGWSPSTYLELAQGQSIEVLYDWSLWETLEDEPRTRYRVQVRYKDGEAFTDPFQPSLTQEATQYLSLERERDWIGERQSGR